MPVVFDGDRGTGLVEGVLAAGFLVFDGDMVGELRAVIVRVLFILMGEASFRRRTKSTLLFPVRSALMCMKTQRVARSIATNR